MYELCHYICKYTHALARLLLALLYLAYTKLNIKIKICRNIKKSLIYIFWNYGFSLFILSMILRGKILFNKSSWPAPIKHLVTWYCFTMPNPSPKKNSNGGEANNNFNLHVFWTHEFEKVCLCCGNFSRIQNMSAEFKMDHKCYRDLAEITHFV